jgi:2-C-methyl-D-erythritol 4-phosphate cytidylyltransferase
MVDGWRVVALLLMAGEGSRFGGPKQFVLLGGAPLYWHALTALRRCAGIDEIVLVCPPGREVEEGERVISGGKSRQESVYLGLQAVEADIVVIHDAARPFVTEGIIEAAIRAAIAVGAADTCIPAVDTMVRSADGKRIGEIPPRAEFFRGQTPQAFRYAWIKEAHEATRGQGATDDCQLILQQGRPVAIVEGSEMNFKITSKRDLEIAEALLQRSAALRSTASTERDEP